MRCSGHHFIIIGNITTHFCWFHHLGGDQSYRRLHRHLLGRLSCCKCAPEHRFPFSKAPSNHDSTSRHHELAGLDFLPLRSQEKLFSIVHVQTITEHSRFYRVCRWRGRQLMMIAVCWWRSRRLISSSMVKKSHLVPSRANLSCSASADLINQSWTFGFSVRLNLKSKGKSRLLDPVRPDSDAEIIRELKELVTSHQWPVTDRFHLGNSITPKFYKFYKL